MTSCRLLVLIACGLLAGGYGKDPNSDSDEVHTSNYEDAEDDHHQPHWSYHGEFSPPRWNELHEHCTGSNPRQSPIDIDPMTTIFEDDLGTISLIEHYSKYRKLNIVNNGHSVNIDIDHEIFVAGGDLPSKGYKLIGIHFHWGKSDLTGSEHTINSRRYPLEMHMVTYDSERYPELVDAIWGENSIAVLGTMFQISEEDNPALIPLISALRDIDEPGSSTTIRAFPITDLLPASTDKYFRYEGSLTTPPCAESVIWTLFLHTQTISSSQLREFRELVEGYDSRRRPAFIEDNWRPVQPTHSRVVYRSFLFKKEYSKVMASMSSSYDGHSAGGASGPSMTIIICNLFLLAKILQLLGQY